MTEGFAGLQLLRASVLVLADGRGLRPPACRVPVAVERDGDAGMAHVGRKARPTATGSSQPDRWLRVRAARLTRRGDLRARNRTCADRARKESSSGAVVARALTNSPVGLNCVALKILKAWPKHAFSLGSASADAGPPADKATALATTSAIFRVRDIPAPPLERLGYGMPRLPSHQTGVSLALSRSGRKADRGAGNRMSADMYRISIEQTKNWNARPGPDGSLTLTSL